MLVSKQIEVEVYLGNRLDKDKVRELRYLHL